MKIGVDLDEVIVEFSKGYFEFYNSKYKTNFQFKDIFSYNLWEVLGISREESFKLADEFYDSEDFDEVELVKDSKESIVKLADTHELFIVTARPIRIREKTDYFFNKNFPNLPYRIIYSGDLFSEQGSRKSDICANLGIEFLVEDNLNYALESAEKGVKVLLLNKPWNKDGKMHEDVVRVDNWKGILEKIIFRK